MIFRILFGLLAVVALVLLFSSPPSEFDEAQRLRRALLCGAMAATSLGMVVPWSRWIRLASPGRTLGFVSKLLGWGGASGIPLAIASGYWLAALGLAVLPVSSVALWKGSAWAAWPWYAVAVASFGGSIVLIVNFFASARSAGESAYAAGQSAGALLGVALWGGVGVALVREVTAWRRRLHSSPPPSP